MKVTLSVRWLSIHTLHSFSSAQPSRFVMMYPSVYYVKKSRQRTRRSPGAPLRRRSQIIGYMDLLLCESDNCTRLVTFPDGRCELAG